MKKETFRTERQFVEASVDFIADVCNNREGQAYIALSGGETPLPVYRTLGERDIDFSGVDFFLTDERYVGLDSEDSNYRAIMDQFGRDRGVRMHFFDTRLEIEEALVAYQRELTQVPNGVFDLIVLGVGVDGHIASLFPHSAAIRSKADLARTTTDAFPVRDRLTMTTSMIMRAKRVLLIAGRNKKQILEKMIFSTETVEDIPAKKLMEHPELTIHFLES